MAVFLIMQQSSQLHHFLRFLQDVGCHVDYDLVEIRSSPLQGLGVFAIQSLNKGQKLATIPVSAVLSVENSTLWNNDSTSKFVASFAEASDDPEENRENICPLTFQLPAAALFEHILGKSSFWYRYLQIMPQSLKQFPSIPLAIPEEQIRNITQGTAVYHMNSIIRNRLQRVFNDRLKSFIQYRAKQMNIKEDLSDILTLDNLILTFLWGTSRAFNLGGNYGNCLVPFADMFNHSTTGEHVHIEAEIYTSDSDSDDANFKEEELADRPDLAKKFDQGPLDITCVRPVNKGHEVFNTFGAQSDNTYLYLNYGFTEQNNPNYTAFVHIDDVGTVLQQFHDSLKGTKLEVTAERKKLYSRSEELIDDVMIENYVPVTTQVESCEGIWLLIYISVVPLETLKPYEEDDIELLQFFAQLSISDLSEDILANALIVWRMIEEHQNAKFPKGTSLQSDLERLKHAEDDHISELQKHTLRIRISQRLALAEICKFLEHGPARKRRKVGNK